MSRFLGVVSTHEGVGSSSVALNLALSLRNLGHSVTVVDLDFESAGLNEHLDLSDLPITLKDVLLDNLHIKEASYKHPGGFSVVPTMSMSSYDHEELKRKVRSLDSDVVILDSDSRGGLHSALDICDDALVVLEPTNHSISHAHKTAQLAEKKGATVLGLLINKGSSGVEPSEFENGMRRRVFGVIPEHSRVNFSNPVVYEHPKGNTAAAYSHVAWSLSNQWTH